MATPVSQDSAVKLFGEVLIDFLDNATPVAELSIGFSSSSSIWRGSTRSMTSLSIVGEN
jgi:hypothetical protein